MDDDLCWYVRYYQHSVMGVGSISILGGPNINIHCDAAICTACMNINKVSRVKYWGGPGPPCPPGSYAYECMHASVYMYVVSKQQGQQRTN